MMVSLIVAMAKNRVIGKDNQLPWHLPADLKHFKTITMGKPIIMGRKTYDSIGRPLPGRRNIVITRQTDLTIAGCDVVNSLQAALALVDDAEVMVIGGTEIFKQALPLAKRLYLTEIDAEFEGDAYFPELDHSQWEVVEREEHQPDETNIYKYEFLILQR